jgi:hypothetical protein
MEEAQCLHDEVLREFKAKSKAYDELDLRYRETALVRSSALYPLPPIPPSP